MKQQTTAAARAYAQSLLELATEAGKADQIGSELDELGRVLEQTPALTQFLRDPSISQEQRADVLRKALAGKVHPLILSTIGVMSRNGRLSELAGVTVAYRELLDARLGKVEVAVSVPSKLSDSELEEVRKRVGTALGRDVVLHQSVDESLIGGMVLRVGDQLLDGSVKTQLQNMRRRLIAAHR
jgi:F-type H+-transporting ATPase subunit delta